MKFFGALLAAPLAALAAPILEPRGEAIPGKWIAVLKPKTSSNVAINSVTNLLNGATPEHTYKIGNFHGYSISASDDVINSIANLDEIDYIEPDYKVSINSLTSQSAAPWGLARISSREPGNTEYKYDESAGEGTYAYIIDTGIFVDHPEFGGRATFGANFVTGNTNNTDENGHGTHVAGTTGSETYGVAKKTNLIGVKVLGADGSGAISQVIAGLQWVVDDATSKGRIGKAVGNISLGALRLLSSSVNTAAAAAVEAGLFLAVAAGNGNLDAALYSPASEPTVCTVGATSSDDKRAPFSNYGSLVDVFAPGVDIISTWNNGSVATISGTSMATPHITGLGAYLLALEGPRDPIALCERMQDLATPDVVVDSLSTHNLLAYNGQS
ncbi:oryzin precursor [Hypomontagnella monticulosa]|nr:oryzin precursor [Hypomontagnella monticulosa]